MSKVVVCGLVNIETSAPIESFPVEYRPIDYKFFSVNTDPAGVGLNLTLALSKLGDEVALCSLCGDDSGGKLIASYLEEKGVSTQYIIKKNKATAKSVVLYDSQGRRYIICDLADNQDLEYDEEIFRKALQGTQVVCLCNINFSAGLASTCKEAGVLVATDVHCLCDIHDEYNSRFMKAADILFLSNENIRGKEEEFIRKLSQEYSPEIIVIGMGDKGAMLYERTKDSVCIVPAVYTRPVVNTVGAGDSLYSAFVHFYADSKDALSSLKKAVYFASYKIGENGASKGFLTEKELLEIMG